MALLTIITAEDLASYLRDPMIPLADLEQIVDLTNGLISEEWSSPVNEIPVKIQLLALSVAARAWVNDPRTAHLESITRTLDDANRTERYRATSERGSVFLTDAELRLLQGGARIGSVRLVLPGDLP